MQVFAKAAVLGVALMTGGAAMGDPLDAATAKDMLFNADGLLLASGDLSAFTPEIRSHYEAIVSGPGAKAFVAEAKANGLAYYGAIAAPKATPPTLQTLTMGGNAHSPGAAAREVLAQCETAAGEACAIVAYLVPEGYSKQPLTLSAAATTGVLESFGKGDGPRYLAYSPTTAGFAVAKGQGADAVALKTCNEAAGGHDDCIIGVVEE